MTPKSHMFRRASEQPICCQKVRGRLFGRRSVRRFSGRGRRVPVRRRAGGALARPVAVATSTQNKSKRDGQPAHAIHHEHAAPVRRRLAVLGRAMPVSSGSADQHHADQQAASPVSVRRRPPRAIRPPNATHRTEPTAVVARHPVLDQPCRRRIRARLRHPSISRMSRIATKPLAKPVAIVTNDHAAMETANTFRALNRSASVPSGSGRART